MLSFQSACSVHNGRTVVPVSRISLSSGKSGMPFISTDRVAYPQAYTTDGTLAKCTVISKISDDSYHIRVYSKGVENMEIVYFAEETVQGLIRHILEDMEKGNHRLYESQSTARRAKPGIPAKRDVVGNLVKPGKPGEVEFHDGISALLSALEWITGESFASKFSPVSRQVGCRSNMPTLEKVVHGQASRHVRVRRPAGSKSFSSGMSTTEMGGAKLPSVTERMARLRASALRNLEKAETQYSEGNLRKAECHFRMAADFEQRASALQSTVNERMAVLRQRAALARAKRAKAMKAAKEAAKAENLEILETQDSPDIMGDLETAVAG